MHPVFVYTASRLGLLIVTIGVLYLLGLRQPLILLIAAFLVSGVASYVLLSKQRDAVSERITKNRE
ncbi:DUF4229 domain-containing protein [Streptosporangium roseum]|uniref:DUF4229 domain-containing protein n=1 Tax=Streptosporangium roseum (strain ATCC 12428 / DSM 43021 / JCM 3005 / KCTC 9067 / NCIMB 10171 / NRRL 2505 / NI 9100) TaxID=479432 RepID=D2B4B8_STRRD|nr:DUF4229 domain-containing protein [Streptosporangium roseum]ACZ83604.1 hypothetical protein Sros_0580 [Streptosporangium roseum DSM 43021]